MPFLIPILARIGIPERFRQAAGILAALLAVALVVGLTAFAFNRWVANERTEAVQIVRADMTIEAANRVIAADRAATANQMTADDAFQNSQEGLRDEARTSGSNDAVGPGTRAVLERLRHEQASTARANTTR